MPFVVLTRRPDGHVAVLDDPAEVPGDGPRVTLADGTLAALVEDAPDLDFAPPREVLLGRGDATALLAALAFGQWYARTRFCVTCGQPLAPTPDGGGRVLTCEAGHHAFPHIEPAVIMRVVDADDRLLLARNPRWPVGRLSVLAGFVEPGETLEDTVRREVHEEVGVHVDDVGYVGSQPWPFPRSLMLAFEARATTTPLRLQEDEIAEAAWFDRAGLRAAMAAGDVALPPPLSVAHQLVRGWLGEAPRTWGAGPAA